MKALKAMGVQETYQNFRENITVDVYSSFLGKKLSEYSIAGLANGVTVNLEAEELPDCIKEFFKEGEEIPESVKWLLTEKDGMTQICILQDCAVNIRTGDTKRDFVLNDAMYKALHGLVSNKEADNK